jgi:hypothetical protein
VDGCENEADGTVHVELPAEVDGIAIPPDQRVQELAVCPGCRKQLQAGGTEPGYHVAPAEPTDPRTLGGDIAGESEVVIDTDRAVLLTGVDVAMARGEEAGDFIAMMLAGRINNTEETARVLFCLNAAGAATIIGELLGLIGRQPDENVRAAVLTSVLARLQEFMPSA